MPITPHFHLTQTVSHVHLDIRVPHIRVSKDTIEVLVDENTVHFSNPPYLLLLDFPGPFAFEAEGESAKYDPTREGGMVTLELKKQQPEYWKDLDLIGQLVKPKKNATILRAQIISQENSSDKQVEENNQEVSDTFLSTGSDIFNINQPRYGFLNLFVGVFSDLVRDGLAVEMLQLPNPDETKASNRREMRLKAEEESFDANRYLGDMYLDDDYIYQTAIKMKPHWKLETVNALTVELASLSTDEKGASNVQEYFSAEEKDELASIPYPILPQDIEQVKRKSLLLGLVDILFAYAYDHLLTDGDPTIESSWTICTLSCTLSWLEEFSALDRIVDIIRFSMRRSLVYPYIRNYEFALYCWDQVAEIFQKGRRCVIRCLLHTRRILDKSEVHYMANRLYLDPYLCLMQNVELVEDTTLLDLGKELAMIQNQLKLSSSGKQDLLLGLIELEKLLHEHQEIAAEEHKKDKFLNEEAGENIQSSCNEKLDENSAKRLNDELTCNVDPFGSITKKDSSNITEEDSSSSKRTAKPLIVELWSL